ncbi:MAG: hypothetical protein K2J72_00195 [Oscillospiraceae bacterium]|nr:hypothetical protein [Oscillospiraceae bacterium]
MTDPTNPFDTEYARELISEIASDRSSDSVFWTNEAAFECVLYNADDDEEECYEEEVCYEVWAAACLYDAMLNGTDYSAFCRGYEDSFSAAVKRLEKDTAKKKFLSKKPVYDISELLQNAIDALDVVMGMSADSELAERMKRRGVTDRFESTIIDLQNRLSAHIEE